jgi:hypothetical protein
VSPVTSPAARTLDSATSIVLVFILATFATVAVSCSAGSTHSNGQPNPLTPSLAHYLTHSRLPAGASCPVTRPGDRHGPAPSAARRWLGADRRDLYGQGNLWVLLPRAPVARRRHGQIYSKIAWFVDGPGRLRIVGRRIDRVAGPLHADVPNAGGGSSEAYMQPTAITTPTLGCWDIVGVLGSSVVEWIYTPVLAHP